MHPNIDIFGTTISSFFLCMSIGIVVPIILAVILKPKDFHLSRLDILLASALAAISGLFGARLLFIALHWDPMKFKLSDLFNPLGGYAYFGALLFSLTAIMIYVRMKKMKLLAMLDYAAPFLMLSQVFVRIGCFLGGCCYGRHTDIVFGVRFKVLDQLPRHPTQLYEMFLLIAIFIITRAIYKRGEKEKGSAHDGVVLFTALTIYGFGRFFIEGLRTDSPELIFGLTIAQTVCLVLFLLSISGLFRAFANKNKRH